MSTSFAPLCRPHHHRPPRSRGQVWRILAGVVHLGDVAFEAAEGFEEGSRVAGAGARRALHTCAQLWGLAPAQLQGLLTSRLIDGAKGEGAILKPLSPAQASAARDNVAKLVYAQLFDWIVKRTNDCLEVGRPKEKKIRGEKRRREVGRPPEGAPFYHP